VGEKKMIKITNELLDIVSDSAKKSERKRKNYNFHPRLEDPLQRLLNAVEPPTYLQPHKHENPDKSEIFIILRGKVLIVEFDDQGEIIDHFVLDWEGGNKGVEIRPGTWHSFISLQEDSVLYEVKEGPYDQRTAKDAAPWAPEEGSEEGAEFNKKVLRKLEIL